MNRSGQIGGRRWETQERVGLSHREAGRQGGRGHRYNGGGPGLGHAAATREEVALRWFSGEKTQAALAEEYGVARSTIRRWCSEREESGE